MTEQRQSDKLDEAKMLRLPWKWLPDEGHFIVDVRGNIVAEVPCQGVENEKEIGAAIVRAVNASVAAVPESGAPSLDDPSPFGLVMRLRKEAEKWSGTACRSDEQFFMRDLIREAARMIEQRVVAAPVSATGNRLATAEAILRQLVEAASADKLEDFSRTSNVADMAADFLKGAHITGNLAARSTSGASSK